MEGHRSSQNHEGRGLEILVENLLDLAKLIRAQWARRILVVRSKEGMAAKESFHTAGCVQKVFRMPALVETVKPQTMGQSQVRTGFQIERDHLSFVAGRLGKTRIPSSV